MTELKDSGVNLRKTNPTLYRNSMALAGGALALAINFLKYTPPFSPFGIPKWVPEIAFGVLGVWMFVFILIHRHLRLLRLGQTAALVAAIIWGAANTQQTRTFGGTASWQLPIMLAFYAVIAVNTLLDAPTNPLMEKK